MQWQHRREINRRARNGVGNGNGNLGNSSSHGIGNGSNHGNGNGSDAGSNSGVAPSSPTRAAIHSGVFHSTGNMAFGGGGTPSHNRHLSGRIGNVGLASGAGALCGISSPMAVGSGGSSGGLGSGSVTPLTPLRARVGRGGSGGGSSSGSALSAGGCPVVDSRGSGPQARDNSTGARVAGGGGGGGGARTGSAGGGNGGGEKDLASKSLPCTPRKEVRNPLLTSFTPSPTLKGLKQKVLGGVFASTGGSQ